MAQPRLCPLYPPYPSDASDTRLESLAQLWARSVAASHDFLDPGQIATLLPHLPERLARLALCVAYSETGAAQGFVAITPSPEEGARHIELLFVDPACWGQGLGSTLLTWALTQGARQVAVLAETPAALAFYQRRGFIPTGLAPLPHPAAPSGQPLTVITLAWVG